MGDLGRVCTWNAQNGQLDASAEPILFPLDIEFTSDTEFYARYQDKCQPYVVTSQGLVKRPVEPRPFSPQERQLGVDDAREWVVSDSKRICWIPPGYIGSVESSYCWAGSSLFMAGQDGMLRKLTFSPSS